MSTRRVVFRIAIVVCSTSLLLAIAGVVLVPALRWRTQLAALKLAGSITDLSWGELLRLVRPGAPYNVRPLVETKNPHRTIENPFSSDADVEAGREAFRALCSTCHGLNARGDERPDLTETRFRHGDSDWALFRAISRGIPGTPMVRRSLPERDAWQLVAFVRELRREAMLPGAPAEVRRVAPVHGVTYEELLRAEESPDNWLTYSGTYTGQRYSRLAQINLRTLARLRLLWTYQTEALENPLKFETTPLVVDGIMFLTEQPNDVAALDAETGDVLWRYRRQLPSVIPLCCGRVNRGLAILDSTLYLGTLDARLVALDAGTGRVRWEVEVADHAGGYSITGAPLALHDLVVVGVAGGEFGIRGFLDAYDAKSGHRRWRFYTVPAPGEPGSETWSGDSWRIGGGPTWLTGSYDPELDLVYWGVGNPSPEFNGDERLGDNLYTNSVVALEATTGKLAWHFQFTPHDEYDWDAAQIPVLVDTVFNGRPRKLMLWANRNAFYYVLDRETGEFLTAREFATQTWTEGIDSTGRPIVRPNSAPSRSGTQVYPATATSWWSPTFSQRTGLFYVVASDRAEIFFKGPIEFKVGEPFAASGKSRDPTVPQRTAVRALDPLSGQLRWEYAFRRRGPIGGLLSTAGDLVFAGEERWFVALDARSGERLWQINTGGDIFAAPITYLQGGRQQVTIAAGRTLMTFGLE